MRQILSNTTPADFGRQMAAAAQEVDVEDEDPKEDPAEEDPSGKYVLGTQLADIKHGPDADVQLALWLDNFFFRLRHATSNSSGRGICTVLYNISRLYSTIHQILDGCIIHPDFDFVLVVCTLYREEEGGT